MFSVGAGNHVTALKPPHVAALAGLLAEDRWLPAYFKSPFKSHTESTESTAADQFTVDSVDSV